MHTCNGHIHAAGLPGVPLHSHICGHQRREVRQALRAAQGRRQLAAGMRAVPAHSSEQRDNMSLGAGTGNLNIHLVAHLLA